MFQEHGAKVIALQDHSATLANSRVSTFTPRQHVEINGGLAGFPGASPISGDDFWLLKTDFSDSAALRARSCPSGQSGSAPKS